MVVELRTHRSITTTTAFGIRPNRELRTIPKTKEAVEVKTSAVRSLVPAVITAVAVPTAAPWRRRRPAGSRATTLRSTRRRGIRPPSPFTPHPSAAASSGAGGKNKSRRRDARNCARIARRARVSRHLTDRIDPKAFVRAFYYYRRSSYLCSLRCSQQLSRETLIYLIYFRSKN